jgi:hypothetical protein
VSATTIAQLTERISRELDTLLRCAPEFTNVKTTAEFADVYNAACWSGEKTGDVLWNLQFDLVLREMYLLNARLAVAEQPAW